MYGWSSSFSSILSVIASGPPSTPAAVVVLLNNLNIEIQWVAPTTNFATITAYQITIITSTSTYIEDLTYCDGS